MKKHLLTTGCSFSERETTCTWVAQIDERYAHLFISTHHTGLGSTAGDLAARKVIWACEQKKAEGIDPKDLLVIVWWTTLNRRSFLLGNTIEDSYGIDIDRLTVAKERIATQQRRDELGHSWLIDVGIDYNNNILDDNQPSWVWFNDPLDSTFAAQWFCAFDSQESQYESRLWDMLAVQNYCKANNIAYYYTNINHDFNTLSSKFKEEWFVKHLFASIDHSLDFMQGNDVVGYLESIDQLKYFDHPGSDFHPNYDGYRLILDNILIPRLQIDGVV